MRNQKTVVVLGAGASAGFGLPLGSGLRDIIARDLNIKFEFPSNLVSGSYEIVEALRLMVRTKDGQVGDINPHRAAAVQTANSMRMSSSIDEYIERHSNDQKKVDCARLAIAKAILEAERRSVLYFDRGNENRLDTASDTWLAYLLRDTTRAKSKGQLSDAFGNVTFVNFNYDRCIEHFAFHWLQRMYDLGESQAAEICSSIKIYHPYGSMGPLPHQASTRNVPFGGEVNASRLVDIAQRIRTYSEAVEESAKPDFLAADLASAAKFVFIGFGFHQQNVDLLGSSAKKRPTLRCYATTDGIPNPRLEIIKSRVASAMQIEAPNGLFFEGLSGNCEAFWHEYGEVLVQ